MVCCFLNNIYGLLCCAICIYIYSIFPWTGINIHMQSFVLCWVVYSLTWYFFSSCTYCMHVSPISLCNLDEPRYVYDRSYNTACCLCRICEAIRFIPRSQGLTWQSCTIGKYCRSDSWNYNNGGIKASIHSCWIWWQTSRARVRPFLHKVIFSISRYMYLFYWL
jgi:hypothetical protein